MGELASSSSFSSAAPASFPAGDQTRWIDVSGFLSSVCNEIEVGQLMHGENFSLFEAMSALEIMDPKMDAGMLITGYRSIEDAIENGAAPVRLSALQLVDVMDHLLVCEATWHRGHCLAQTVFSCLYLLRLDRTTPNPLLHAYCKVMRATCSLLRMVVSTIHTNEEEDLFTLEFGLPLDGEADNKCLSGLNSVEEVVARKLRRCKCLTSKKKIAEDIEPLQQDPNLEEGYCEAILCRLRFRKALYQAASYLQKPQGRGLEMAHKHITMAVTELAAIQESTKFLSSCFSSHFPDMKDNSSGVDLPTTASGQKAIGFDASVNRWLSSPTPLRSMKFLSWEQTLEYFEKLLQDLDHICSFTTNLGLEDLVQVVVDFQKYQPDLVARAFLQFLLVQDGKLFGRDSLSSVLCKALNLPLQIVSKEFETDNFVIKSGQLCIHLVRVLCTNWAWQRRKLGKIFVEWGMLLQQIEMIRSDFLLKTLASLDDKDWWENVVIGWAAEQTCWIAMHFLMLGFELKLYSPNEFCMVYWYLDHVILTLLHYRQLKRRNFESEQVKGSDSMDSSKRKGKKKKGSMKTMEKKIHPNSCILLLQCYLDCCKALFYMLAALVADGKLTYHQNVFNTEEERFLQRFELFQKAPLPEPLSYFEFNEAAGLHNHSVKEQYELANHYFMALQQHLQELGLSMTKGNSLPAHSISQRLQEIRQLEQVALRNRIALQIMDYASPGDSFRVSFEFSQHSCFAVASLKKL